MSDTNGQQTVPKAPDFGASAPFSYGPAIPTEIKVKDASGKTVDIDPKTAVKGSGTPGTFTVQPLAPKSVTYKPNYASVPKIPVGGEVKKGPTSAELEAMRIKADLHAELTKIGLDLKDMVHEAGELKKKKLKPETLAFLESAEDKTNNAFAEAYGEPDREKIDYIDECKAEFIEAIEKAGEEVAALPPEVDQEKELQTNIIKLTPKVMKVVQHGRALEDSISNPDFLRTFKESREDLERTLVELADHPDEAKRKKLEQDLGYYERSIEAAEDFIAKNPKPAQPAAAPAPQEVKVQIPVPDIFSSWKLGNLRKFSDKQKEASFAQNKYRDLVDKARKTGQLDLCKDIIEEKLHIQKEIGAIDPSSKEKYLDIDLSGILKTFISHIDEAEEKLKEILDKRGEVKNLESARKKLVENIHNIPEAEYKKQIGRISDGGATELTINFLKNKVKDFVSEAKKLENKLEGYNIDQVKNALEDLEEKKSKVETLLNDEEKRRSIINNNIVLRPFKLTNRTKKMIFSNSKTGQQIQDEQDALKEHEKNVKESKERETLQELPKIRERYERAFNDDPQAFIHSYTDGRGTDDNNIRYTMNKRLMEHPYKNIIADVLTDPENEHHLDNLSEPDKQDLFADRLLAKDKSKLDNANPYRQVYSPAVDPYALNQKPNHPYTEEEQKEYEENMRAGEEHPKMDLTPDNYQNESMVASPEVAERMATPNEEPREKLKAVDQLMNTVKNPYFWGATAAAILAAGIASVATEGTQEQKVPIHAEASQEKDWKTTFMEELGKKDPRFVTFSSLVYDLPSKSPEDIMKKYVPSFFARESSPARVRMALSMWGNLVQNDATNQHYENLLPEERKELSDLRTVLDMVSFITSGEKLKTNTNFEQEIMEAKQKVAQNSSQGDL